MWLEFVPDLPLTEVNYANVTLLAGWDEELVLRCKNYTWGSLVMTLKCCNNREIMLSKEQVWSLMKIWWFKRIPFCSSFTIFLHFPELRKHHYLCTYRQTFWNKTKKQLIYYLWRGLRTLKLIMVFWKSLKWKFGVLISVLCLNSYG